MTIPHALEPAFVERNTRVYPNLDPDFIRQICFEHPDRFDQRFPLFDPTIHLAVRRLRSAGWLYDNVREEDGAEPDSWGIQFDQYLLDRKTSYFVFNTMVATGAWPFPPVITDAEVARAFGSPYGAGTPYCLIEGYHRVSYMRRMVQLGMLSRDRELEVIELMASRSTPLIAEARESLPAECDELE